MVTGLVIYTQLLAWACLCLRKTNGAAGDNWSLRMISDAFLCNVELTTPSIYEVDTLIQGEILCRLQSLFDQSQAE